MRTSDAKNEKHMSEEERRWRRRGLWRKIGRWVDPWDADHWEAERAKARRDPPEPVGPMIPYEPTQAMLRFYSLIRLIEMIWGIDSFPRGLARTESLAHAVDGEMARRRGGKRRLTVRLPTIDKHGETKMGKPMPIEADLDVYEIFLAREELDVDWMEECADVLTELDRGPDYMAYPPRGEMMHGDAPSTARKELVDGLLG